MVPTKYRVVQKAVRRSSVMSSKALALHPRFREGR